MSHLPPPIRSAPPAARGGCARALLGLLGVILILPGGCAILLSIVFISELPKLRLTDFLFLAVVFVVLAALLVVGFRLILDASDSGSPPDRNAPTG